MQKVFISQIPFTVGLVSMRVLKHRVRIEYCFEFSSWKVNYLFTILEEGKSILCLEIIKEKGE